MVANTNIYNTASVAAQSNHQTVSFTAETDEYDVHLSPSYDSTRDIAANSDADLAQFFARPIVTPLVSWVPFSVGDVNISFNPWTDFFSNPRVANRIANYNLLSCNLKVKFMINGNPFYYGRLLADYNPFYLTDNVSQDAVLNLSSLVTASQRMHLFLDPTTSLGGTMTLPFVYWKDKASIINNDVILLGNIRVRELVKLKQTSGSTTPVELSVAIWAEDVKLAAPTSDESVLLVPQSDEYGSTPISSVATAISQAAGKLWSIPYIGPYARATSMVSSAIGQIAKAFGYSRPVILDAIIPMRPTYLGNMVNCDAPDSSVKLSVDSKQELSIDPRTFGADLGDELVLSRLASVQSWITGFPWPTSAVPGDHLMNFRVTPCHSRLSGGIYYPTASAFVAQPFRYWKGTVRFRFQIVASAFHRGRLKIVYDPSFCKSVESNVAFTRVIDLAQERDFTIDVAWANTKTWLKTDALAASNSNRNAVSYNAARSDNTNGVLAVYVLNTLTSTDSVTNNDITINAFISMTDDAEFAVPTELNTIGYTYPYSLVPQSEPYGEQVAINTPDIPPPSICLNNCLEPNESDLVYIGEKISSFRQLLKRYSYYKSQRQPTAGSISWITLKSDFPAYPGYSTNGEDSTGTNNYVYGKAHLLHYLTPAFACVKGSLRSKYHIVSKSIFDITSFSVNKGLDGTSPSSILNTISVASPSLYARERMLNNPDFSAGAVMTPPFQNPYIEVEHPYQVAWRFAQARSLSNLPSDALPCSLSHTVHVVGETANPLVLDRYVATGEDFSLFWFCGAPPRALRVIPDAALV